MSPDEYRALTTRPPRKNKFGAKRVKRADGLAFDSQAEARRYDHLRLMQRAGEISALVVHERWPLAVAGIVIGHYTCDFCYRDKAGNIVVEDVKGVRTREFIRAKKHMAAQYGIEILETGARRTKKTRRG